jgi:hypothetical protein
MSIVAPVIDAVSQVDPVIVAKKMKSTKSEKGDKETKTATSKPKKVKEPTEDKPKTSKSTKTKETKEPEETTPAAKETKSKKRKSATPTTEAVQDNTTTNIENSPAKRTRKPKKELSERQKLLKEENIKRPSTGYQIFGAEFRAKLAADADPNTDLKTNQSEVMTTIGAQWKALSEDQQAAYNQRAAPAQADFKLRKEAFNKAHSDLPADTRAPSKKPRTKKVKSDSPVADQDNDNSAVVDKVLPMEISVSA